MNSKRLIFLSVLAILILAFSLRVYRLNINLPPLYADEVGGHYQAEIRFSLPAATAFDWLYSHSCLRFLSFTWFLGLTPLAVRLPSAIWGTVLLIFMYLFALSINIGGEQKRTQVALGVLVLGGFLPWAIQISRIGYVSIPLVLGAICLHLYLFFKSNQAREYLLSLLPLLLAAYLYPSMLIISPFIVFFTLSYTLRLASKKTRYTSLVLILLFAVVLAAVFFRSASRGLDLAIWRDINVTADSNLYRGLANISQPTIFSFGQNPQIASRLVYNFPISVINIFTRNYLSFFSLDFLFLKGDTILRHSTGQVGAFYPFLIPFLVYGTFLLFRSKNEKIKQAFLVWILISPIPAAITKDGANYLLRAVTMMPFLTYLAALGLVGSINLVRPKLRVICPLGFFLIGLYSVYCFLFGYFQVYPARAARSYEFGFKEVSDFQITQGSKPLLVIWDGYYPHYYFRFWQATSARSYSQFVPRSFQTNQTVFYQMFPNLFISLPKNEADLQEFIEENPVSYIVFPTALVEKFSGYSFLKFSPLATVFYPDGSAAFYIYPPEQLESKK